MKYLNSKIGITLLCFFTVIMSYAQNPDGRVTFNLLDDGVNIQFESLKYTYNNNLLIKDKTETYSIKLKTLERDDNSSVSNLGIRNIEGISNLNLDIGWASKIIIEFTRTIRNKNEIMRIFFDNVQDSQGMSKIEFKEGDYWIDIQCLFESTPYPYTLIINQKDFKKI